MTERLRGIAVFAPALLLTTASAHAQEPAGSEPPAAPAAKEAEPPPASPPAPAASAPTPVPFAMPAAAVTLSPPSASPLRIDGPTGFNLRIGLLVQPQLQSASSATHDGYAHNLYVRRTRILLGGTLFSRVEFFLDTDYPNLFLPSNTAAAGEPQSFTKNTPGMNIQDVFVTYKAWGDRVKVDMGYMLPPLGHNAIQGATTLYGWDYFGFTFQHSNAFGSSANPVGRDAGLQLRGLLVGGLLEYRLGMFQGRRENRTATEVEARNFFRLAGRLQVNLLDPEPGFFYAGSYLGTRRIASLGAAFDVQDSYKHFAVDAFVDMPLGPGVITAQVNFGYWNGNGFLTLAKQSAVMGEVGYMFAGLWLSPIFRMEQLWGSGAVGDQTRVGGGVAFWPYGHNTNLKAFYTYANVDGAPRGTNQFNLQWQVYFF